MSASGLIIGVSPVSRPFNDSQGSVIFGGAGYAQPSHFYWAATEHDFFTTPLNGIYRIAVPDDPFDPSLWFTNLDSFLPQLVVNVDDTNPSFGANAVRIDEESGYIFYFGGSPRDLVRTSLTGGSPLSSGGLQAWHFALNRKDKTVIVYDNTTWNEYDYDFNFIRQLRTGGGTTEFAPAVNLSGTHLVFQKINYNGSEDHVVKMNLADLGVSSVQLVATNNIASSNYKCRVDEDAGKVIWNGALGIQICDWPDGGNLTTLKSSGMNRGIAVDMFNKRIMWMHSAAKDFYWFDYVAGNEVQVINLHSGYNTAAFDNGHG